MRFNHAADDDSMCTHKNITLKYHNFSYEKGAKFLNTNFQLRINKNNIHIFMYTYFYN